jgi:hypothetical protein
MRLSFIESLHLVVAETLESIAKESTGIFEPPAFKEPLLEDPWEEVIDKIWKVIDR